MAIAMKDLEIRGAGNLLGGQQSGHIADVGFDLYIQLVGEAVAEYRGQDVEPEPEVRIELPVDAHLPADYVESERLRLEMYKRLAEVRAEADVKAVEAELHDRYGAPPPEVLNLIEVARFRLLARSTGAARDRRARPIPALRARSPAGVTSVAAAAALPRQRGQGHGWVGARAAAGKRHRWSAAERH
jgi:transcription-repair coupling factor (superfamily II helicase)